ncbi:carbohydrate ABC transporter permease [Leifsonia xyli]|uniref:carbohydrate ABC transporter permease n=1 Tax=Leifsonia xyli TaxID=1575 RepID=UPI003D67E9B1
MTALGEATVAAEAEVVPATPGGLRKESAWRRRDRRWGYVFVGPQLAGMTLFVVVPFVASLVLAFAKWDGLNDLGWVGLDNFRAELADPLFGRSIVNTLLIALITVPVGLGLAVVLAVALERLKTRTLYLILFFAPVVTSSVAVAMIWQQLLRKDGVVSGFIANVFHVAPRTGWATCAWR